MPKVEGEKVASKIKKIYADAKKSGKFVPPTVARAMALSMVTGRKKK